MAEALIKLFGKSAKVLVKDGDFNNVEGQYHHYDYSQRITNNGCYNIIGTTLHNVSNTRPQDIYHERGARSMRHGRFATNQVTMVDGSAISRYSKFVVHHQSDLIHGYFIDNHASSSYHNPQSQVSIRNNPTPLSHGSLSPQIPGQRIQARLGDIHEMSTAQFAFMKNQMAHMRQEMDSEFDNEEQNTIGPEISEMYDDDTSEDETSVATKFNRLTIEERVSSSPRSALIHGSSSTAARAGESLRHTIISGDHTEVDDRFYQFDFNSHKVENNIIKNSFGDGEQEDIVIQLARRKLKQSHVPRRG